MEAPRDVGRDVDVDVEPRGPSVQPLDGLHREGEDSQESGPERGRGSGAEAEEDRDTDLESDGWI